MEEPKGLSFVEQFVKEKVPDLSEKKLEKQLVNLYQKPILLLCEKSGKVKKKKQKKSLRQCKADLKRALTQNSNYAEYEPLRKMWSEYIREVLYVGGKKQVDMKMAQEVFLKADLHGAVISVVLSNCKHLEKTKGTIITESKNMFQIVTLKNTIRNIPKKNSVFEIIFENLRVTIFGDQFCIKPSQRLTKKFKNYIPVLPVI
nr:ribonuclease P protein subunit p29-like [Ciona intestinalis]|eukprot:XP_026693315.1 ribonuclease P protein subunit p29-like [Ciona intestinalis]